MKKSIILSGAAALAVASTAVVAQAGDRRGNADANEDGIVTLQEARTAAATGFARLDANGDGQLDTADREAMKAKMQERRAERFAASDANDDGELSQDEIAAARAERGAKRFARMDADNSGGLSQEELGKRGKWRCGKRGHHRMGIRGHRAMRGMMMKKADSDGNGSISQAEFTAAAETRFAKVDANGDGQITAEERKAAHEKMREMRGKRRNAGQEG